MTHFVDLDSLKYQMSFPDRGPEEVVPEAFSTLFLTLLGAEAKRMFLVNRRELKGLTPFFLSIGEAGLEYREKVGTAIKTISYVFETQALEINHEPCKGRTRETLLKILTVVETKMNHKCIEVVVESKGEIHG